MYVEEIIREEYKQWKPADIILINAPTGSGKSHFVFNVLLKYAIITGQKILYLVNRKILRDQLDKMLHGEVTDEMLNFFGYRIGSISNFIRIETYQKIESELANGVPPQVYAKYYLDYSMVIYDEFHYFYTDSSFNTYTELSYDFLRLEFNDRIQVFMSATMESMQQFIYTRPAEVWLEQRLASGNGPVQIYQRKRERYKYYEIPNDFSNISVRVFEDINVLKKTIINSDLKDKWLIFVDNINIGKNFLKELIRESEECSSKELCLTKDDAVFIDADYENVDVAYESVKELCSDNLIRKKVVISTAVMDNGVSFHDEELRNIVILSDTKESFLQMLGRKRRDGTPVQLYICKRKKEYFTNRLQNINNIYRFYERHQKNMENLGNVGCLSPKPLYLKVYDNDLVNSNYIQPLLQEIIQKDLSYQSAKALCYPLKGLIAFNSFSINRICDLKKNYRDIVNRMENDENAFIKLQMRWLEKSIEEVEIVICEADDISWKNHVENLEREIQIILNNKELRQLSSEENKEWKIKIRSDIEYFLKKEGSADDKKLKAVMRTDSPIQSEPFNEAMKIASLPYEMKKLNGSIFAVEKI